jgi:bacteriocin biosynthesis cyclodehydratase domain-containing protein
VNPHGLPDRPQLKPWYRLARADGSLVLEYGGKALVLEGEATARLMPALLPLLDGTRSVEEITAALGEPIEPAVSNALTLLGNHGLLTEPFPDGKPAAPRAETARFLAATSPRGCSPPRVSELLSEARAAVAGDGSAAAELARLLRVAGVDQVERASLRGPAPSADLVLAAPAPEELPALAEWNVTALAAAVAWLVALPFDGNIAAVGPLFVPAETCCYECYRLRRATNSGYFAEYRALEREPAAYPVPPVAVAAVAGVASLVALRWLVDRDPALPGMLFALDLRGAPTLTAHHVYRVPRCPACSAIARVAPVLPWFERDAEV